MGFESIREKLKTKLRTISSIQQVEDFPNDQWGGYPAALITSARNESTFQTTIENKRTYVFAVFILQELETAGEQKARRIIEGVTDDVIEALDKDQLLTGISLPTNETMIIAFPTLSNIYTSDDSKYVVGELEIRVNIQFNTEL